MSEFYKVVVVYIENLTQETVTSLIQTAINELQCRGAEEFSLSEPAVDELLGERSYSGGDLPLNVLQEVDQMANRSAGLKFYFDGEDAHNLANIFCKFVFESVGQSPTIESHANEDWNNTWREHFKPIPVSNVLTVVPSWESAEWKTPERAIFIYPGQGFGTGNHETTFLCLTALSNIVISRRWRESVDKVNVLDFGCGSAILGLASGLMIGKNTIVDLYDIDPTAIENAHQNISWNAHILSEFKTYLPSQRQNLKARYKLVFANILAPVLEDEADYLTSILDYSGFLIISGLLTHQVEEIEKMYLARKEIRLVEKLTKGDWGCLVLTKN